MKIKTVSKRTWNTNVRKFAIVRDECWRKLEGFVDSHTRKASAKERDAFMDELCELVDTYILFSSKLRDYCYKINADLEEFICDVENLDIEKVMKAKGKGVL